MSLLFLVHLDDVVRLSTHDERDEIALQDKNIKFESLP